jgi:DNA mismatch endonuclease (patch repair protein)
MCHFIGLRPCKSADTRRSAAHDPFTSLGVRCMFRTSMSVLVPPSEQRSRNMAAIRSRDTRLEMAVRQTIHARGFRYRLHRTALPGKPDLVFPRFRVVALVHGCYWHGHICKEAKRPRTNLSYWVPKIEGNMARDARNIRSLREQGWEVIIIRECSVRDDTEKLLSVLSAKRATI